MKKALAIVLAMALLCIISVGGTLSYFTDTDGDVNTMTVGQVLITQHEKDRNGNAFDDTTVVLLPVTNTTMTNVGGYSMLDPQYNAVDKIVTVTVNAGSQSAFVRTVFAFEMMKIGTDWVNPLDNSDDKAEVRLNVNGTLTWPNVEFEKNGIRYVVGVFTYDAPIPANTTTAPSLLQVYLNSNVGNEFFDAVNNSYEILVLSQAVQAAGFGNAADAFAAAFPYGENNANVAGWFNEVN